jgi:hypothetical protein
MKLRIAILSGAVVAFGAAVLLLVPRGHRESPASAVPLRGPPLATLLGKPSGRAHWRAGRSPAPALRANAVLAPSGVAPAATAGGLTRLVSSDKRDQPTDEAAPDDSAPRDSCEALQAHVDELAAKAAGGGSEHRAALAERGDSFVDACRRRPPDAKATRCFMRASSLDDMLDCGAAAMPPEQRAVHARLMKELESGVLDSDDPAVVVGAVKRSLELDDETAAEIEALVREQMEASR